MALWKECLTLEHQNDTSVKRSSRFVSVVVIFRAFLSDLLLVVDEKWHRILDGSIVDLTD